jgi:hypothetical protein
MAVFIVSHFNSMSVLAALVLIGIGIVMVFIVMGVLLVAIRSTPKK